VLGNLDLRRFIGFGILGNAGEKKGGNSENMTWVSGKLSSRALFRVKGW